MHGREAASIETPRDRRKERLGLGGADGEWPEAIRVSRAFDADVPRWEDATEAHLGTAIKDAQRDENPPGSGGDLGGAEMCHVLIQKALYVCLL